MIFKIFSFFCDLDESSLSIKRVNYDMLFGYDMLYVFQPATAVLI